ncbi:MAG: serine acetyltransferase [Lachnospiraceae bacterium]|nr:serine acetyltransferase [Lachnospiraceae bacterium]
MENNTGIKLHDITRAILDDYEKGRDIDKLDTFAQPDQEVVTDILLKLINIIFPGFYRDKNYKSYNHDTRICVLIEDVYYNLRKQTSIALGYSDSLVSADNLALETRADEITAEFMQRIPAIRALVDTDLEATIQGDPAASSKEEIILCYPGLLASTTSRIAHELFLLNVPMIPRMMTEYAHSRTGIDIHPGATIGDYFFIDHGTGIVVGETAVIGSHVKIYQGVTIGALSTSGGQRLRGVRRHPTIGDNVTIYAGASILGGETVIGDGCVIGSNVFITESVSEKTRISSKTSEVSIRRR